MNQLRHEDSSQDSKYRNYFNESSRFISKNLQLFIVTPTILGGIWQLIELSSLSPSFVRFFSVSQLIADGLLILLLLLLSILTYKVVEFGLRRSFEENSNSKPKNIGRGLAIITISLIGLYTVSFRTFERMLFTDNVNLINSVFGLSVFIVGINALAQGIQQCLFGIFDKVYNYNNVNGLFKVAIVLVVTLTTLTSFVFGLKTIYHARNSYLFPTYIRNLSNIDCYLYNMYEIEKNDWKLNYANDQYLFVTQVKKPNNHIIIRFDILLDPEQCNTIDENKNEENSIQIQNSNDSTTLLIQDSIHN